MWFGTAGQGKTGSQGVQQAIQDHRRRDRLRRVLVRGAGHLNTAARSTTAAVRSTLTATSAGAAVAAATVVGTGNDLTLKLDYATKTPGAYPIILVTYEIVCTKYADAAHRHARQDLPRPTRPTVVRPACTHSATHRCRRASWTKVQASVATIS